MGEGPDARARLRWRTSRRRRSAGLIALAAVLLALMVCAWGEGAGAQALPSLACGEPITSDVRLREDLTCTDGFQVRSGSAGTFHVDLGGHTLTIVNRCSASAPFWPYCGGLVDLASLANGTLVGDVNRVDGVTHVEVHGRLVLSQALMDHSTVIDGQVVVYGPNVTVRDNRLERSSIWLYDDNAAVRDTIVTGNRISDAPGSGILVDNVWSGRGNDLSGVIAHNTVTGSQGDGILVRGLFFTLGPVEIRDNTLRDNGGDGIRIDMSRLEYPDLGLIGPVVVEGNHALSNGGHGIDADRPPLDPAKGVQDGGHNLARDNALDPQCLGVRCQEPPRDAATAAFGGPT